MVFFFPGTEHRNFFPKGHSAYTTNAIPFFLHCWRAFSFLSDSIGFRISQLNAHVRNMMSLRSVVPNVLNKLDTIWRSVFSFTPRLLYLRRELHQCLYDRSKSKLQNKCELIGEEKNPVSFQESIPGRQACIKLFY
jgi:hypothetical protein